MNWYVGTSGYSYKEWKGSFYPEKLPATEMLRFYGERFKTVEINNTFYRMPSDSVLTKWAGEVPDGFAFVLKASRRITHEKRLKNTEDAVGYFLKNAAVLGAKLGPLLFQLPPFLRKDLAALAGFLSLIPSGRRAAFEFRHASWYDDEVFEVLRSHGAVLCAADTGGEEDAPLVATADWGYLRLRREAYEDRSLFDWGERVRSQPWGDAFVFFKHEDEGTGPKLAARFVEVNP